MDQFDKGSHGRQREEVVRQELAEADRAREQGRLVGRTRGRTVDRRVLVATIIVVLLVVLVVTILAWSAGSEVEDPVATAGIDQRLATERWVAPGVPAGHTLVVMSAS